MRTLPRKVDFPLQALCFAGEMEVRESLLRKRILLLQDTGFVQTKLIFQLNLCICICHSRLLDLPEKEKKEHTATALTLLGEQRTTEEEELLSGLLQEKENQENLDEKSLIGSQRHQQLPVFSNSVKLESQPGRGRFIMFIIISLLV